MYTQDSIHDTAPVAQVRTDLKARLQRVEMGSMVITRPIYYKTDRVVTRATGAVSFIASCLYVNFTVLLHASTRET